MAEGLCRKFLQARGLCGDITVGSAGIGNSCGNRRPAVIFREFLAGLGIERRGAFDAIMLVGTPVLQILIFAAYGTE